MQNLFEQFKSTSTAEWKAQLLKDLKGLPYEDLIWHNENGFDLQPFYNAENLNQKYFPAFSHHDWSMSIRPLVKSDEQMNGMMLAALKGGANAICVDVKNRNLEIVLKDISLDFIHSTFIGNASEINQLEAYLKKNYAVVKIDFSVLPANCQNLAELNAFELALNSMSIKPSNNLAGDSLGSHNQNCGAALELALLFSQLVEFTTQGQKQAVVRMGVSADYFVQMAKLRALRRLWEIFKKDINSTSELYVIAETSLTNKNISDRHNNLLRSTVEAMAAISGGCNELVIQDFEVITGMESPLSQRMAINQQHILREESYFDKMADVACGSYFVESLTDLLAEKALALFKDFEKKGGYFACLSAGIIQNAIDTAAAQSATAFESGKQVSIGINKFRNEKEKANFDPERLTLLEQVGLNNPALKFELNNFFDLKNA